MIRTLTHDDLDTAFQINEVGIDTEPVDRAMLDQLYGRSIISLAAIDPSSDMVGFCLITDTRPGLLPPRSAWAVEHRDAGLHIERIAFRPDGSGHGLGVQLFDQIDDRVGDWARATETAHTPLTSIIRVEPLNEHGWKFHQVRGFAEIDRRAFGETTWALMQKHHPS